MQPLESFLKCLTPGQRLEFKKALTEMKDKQLDKVLCVSSQSEMFREQGKAILLKEILKTMQASKEIPDN